jgi:hypothetical protein
MNDVISSISAREIASAIWLCVFLVFSVSYPRVRRSLADILRALFQPVIIAPLIVAAVYAAGEIFLLWRLGLWSAANLKTTLLWLLTFAFVSMFQLVSIKARKSGLGKITRDILTITGILVFITELHSFSLAVELFALPIVTILALGAEVAKHNPEQAPAAKLLGCLTALIGWSYLGLSLWMSVKNWNDTATRSNALEFALPILLSVGFLPFLYAWRIYIAYSESFATLTVFGLHPSLVPYARWLALTRIRNDLDLLERWRKAIQTVRPQTKPELKHSLTALVALRVREDSPPIVPAEEGWSPYSAMQFMKDYGFDTGHYHQSFDDEWFASTPMQEFGDHSVFPNNLAYYIEGAEHAATTLKLKLNINDPPTHREAEEMFVVCCMHLLGEAAGSEVVESMKLRIAALEEFQANIPFGSATMAREDFVGGIPGGYSRMFSLHR